MEFQLQNGYTAQKALLSLLLVKPHGINNPDATLSLVLILLLSFIAAESRAVPIESGWFRPFGCSFTVTIAVTKLEY